MGKYEDYNKHLSEGHICKNPNGDDIAIKRISEFDNRIYKNGKEIDKKGDYRSARSIYAKLCAGMNPNEKFEFE